MANFQATQTINGLQTFALFTAPAAGIYFVNGQLTLPMATAGASSNSAVVSLVKVNGSTSYTGAAGTTGFYTTLTLAAGDAVTAVLSSAAAPDQPLNAVKGVVASGNAF